MQVNLPRANSGQELLTSLEAVNIAVPRRTAGRKTNHTESWIICRLLSTLAGAELLAYPVSLTYKDRPDFHLLSGTQEVGIEITEASSTQYAKFTALAEREFPDVRFEPGLFRWGTPELTIDEMRKILLSRKNLDAKQDNVNWAEPWLNDEPEKEWAACMAEIVKKKAQKLTKVEFLKFTKNWLAIYDNLPKPHIDLDEAVSFLVPLLDNHWVQAPTFDTIFIEHGQVIVKISSTAKCHLPLIDLWGKP